MSFYLLFMVYSKLIDFVEWVAWDKRLFSSDKESWLQKQKGRQRWIILGKKRSCYTWWNCLTTIYFPLVQEVVNSIHLDKGKCCLIIWEGGGKLKSKANWFSWTWFTFDSKFALILLNVVYLLCCLLSPMDLHLFGLLIIS